MERATPQLSKSTFIAMWVILAVASSVASLLNFVFQAASTSISGEIFERGGPLLLPVPGFLDSPLYWMFLAALTFAHGSLLALYFGAKRGPAVGAFVGGLVISALIRFLPASGGHSIHPVAFSTLSACLVGLPVAWWFSTQRRNPVQYLTLNIILSALGTLIAMQDPTQVVGRYFNFNPFGLIFMVTALTQIALALPMAYWISYRPHGTVSSESETVELFANPMVGSRQASQEESDEVRA